MEWQTKRIISSIGCGCGLSFFFFRRGGSVRKNDREVAVPRSRHIGISRKPPRCNSRSQFLVPTHFPLFITTMTVDNLHELDAHEQPSDQLKALWKSFSKTDQSELLSNGPIDDLASESSRTEFVVSGTIPASEIQKAFLDFDPSESYHDVQDAPIYHHPLLPGLFIVPNLLRPSIQKIMLSKLIHRDLSVPEHQTNLHIHYDLPYPKISPDSEKERPEASSFFTLPPTSPVRFTPLDPSVHKPLSIRQVLERRLHWVTLGGQYDWTARVYPSSSPPVFPPDISAFLERLFPATKAQAAIVNFYGPGDTMMMHRDVSEEVNRGLVSLSMGCEALFMIMPNDVGLAQGPVPGGCQVEKELKSAPQSQQHGSVSSLEPERDMEKIENELQDQPDARVCGNKSNNDNFPEKKYLLLRLRSGDVLYMTGESRYAWHGVPKVLKNTCPEYLKDWPAASEGDEKVDSRFDEWRGWLKNKRINLNVRQMTE